MPKLQPTPVRQSGKILPTPLVADVLFFEAVNCQRQDIPAYGTAHPDATKWPHHKLVYVKDLEDPEKQEVFHFFYAADRANQDLYNWEFGKKEVGGTLFDSVTRSYVKLRGSFAPATPAINAGMPDVPAGVFTGTYKLFSKQQMRIGEKELDALFIAETHTYLKHTGGEVRAKGQDNLTPAKYRRLITTSETETLHDMPALTGGELVPTPTDPTGAQTKVVNRKVDDSQYTKTVTTEVINTSAEPLVGEEYGDIVTKTVTESLVDDGTPAETGLQVVSSVVTPLGNGKAVKETKTVKGGWPNPVEQEVSQDPPSIPAKLRKFFTRLVTKKKVGTLPPSITLSSGQVGKSYKRETPDRLEETTVSETFTPGLTATEVKQDQKPYVKIVSTTKSESTQSLPATGNGSSEMIYDNGTLKIYDNTAEVATARPGPAGTEKQSKPYVLISTGKRYATTPEVLTTNGSAQVVFNDGSIQIYEISEDRAEARTGSAGIEVKGEAWGHIKDTKSYTTSGELGNQAGNTRQIYNDGTVTVWEKTLTNAEPNSISFVSQKSKNALFTETETTTYGLSADTSTDESSSRVIYNDGVKRVYENTRVDIIPSGGRTYYTFIPFSVPAVLRKFEVRIFARKDGQDDVWYEPIIEEGWSGSFKAKVVEKFELSPLGPQAQETPFKERPVNVRTPFGSVNVGPTLHADMTINCTIGTNHPVYEMGNYDVPIPATDPPDWKGRNVLVKYESSPYKTGFITREISIQLP